MAKAKALYMQIKSDWRSTGFRGVIRKHGWKVFATFFVFYLVRDLCFYVLLPYLIGRGLLIP